MRGLKGAKYQHPPALHFVQIELSFETLLVHC